MQQRHVRVSKQMAHVLRHAPPKEMDSAGFVPLPALLRELRAPGVCEELVRSIVAADPKGRYQLDESSAPPRIRAVQGHSVQLAAPELQAVSSADQVPLALHVTSAEGWAGIQESGELRRMSRTHIHFATAGLHMRRNAWADVLLLLDLNRALQDGFEFWLALNGVLLCEGPLPASYVQRIERARLPADW